MSTITRIQKRVISGDSTSPLMILEITEDNISILNDTSEVSWRFLIDRPHEVFATQSKPYWVEINGTRMAEGVMTINGQGTKVLASGGPITLTHDENGELTIPCAYWANLNFVWNGVTVTTVKQQQDVVLTKIPRAPTISQTLASKTETTAVISYTSDSVIDYLWYSTNNGSSWTGIDVADASSGQYTITGLAAGTTYNIKTRVRGLESQLTTDSSAMSVTTYAFPYANSMPNFTIGEVLTLGLYNPLNRTITVSIVGANNAESSGVSVSGTTISGFDSAAWKNFLYGTIPNSKNGTYKVRVVYGTSNDLKTGGTYTIKASECTPSISTGSYQDTNATTTAITGNNQQIVRNKSTVQYSATGLAARNSAIVASCSVKVNGNTYNLTLSGSSASGGNAVINSAYNVDAVFTVTDSRGLTATKTISVTMLDWVLPTALITLHRESNYYTLTTITVDAQFSYVDGHNTISISYKAKKSGTSTYTITGNLQDNVPATFNADNEFDWDVVVTLVDLFGTTTYNVVLSRGMPIIYFDRIKSSVGVNCFPQHDRSFEVDGKRIVDFLYPVGSIYLSVSSTDPATLFGGTWERIKDRFLLASGDTYSNGATGGEATHTLTESEMPSHQHSIINANTQGDPMPSWTSSGVNASSYSTGYSGNVRTSFAGSGASHNNMPPYLAVYVWKRTA